MDITFVQAVTLGSNYTNAPYEAESYSCTMRGGIVQYAICGFGAREARVTHTEHHTTRGTHDSIFTYAAVHEAWENETAT